MASFCQWEAAVQRLEAEAGRVYAFGDSTGSDVHSHESCQSPQASSQLGNKLKHGEDALYFVVH